ncbi:hypothetical protein QNI16_00085 [Cytophagaceae bacterium YF14B1]|uniref:Uncharacterized protein n=1 Tax=Xanthocytophaga flava TaxID=3048013 RepID=A0AAE3QL19_9BACT|nr:hypothetical protein [Xanthocytophaga flavus]MDJ1478856.1 hypothetical protein [Xanthocytophaga flavus]
MTTIDVIQQISRLNEQIYEINFHEFPRSPLLQERGGFDELEKEHFAKAITIREEYNLPFWDSIMLTFFSKEKTSDFILASALNHNNKINLVSFQRQDFSLIKEFADRKLESNLAFNSRIITISGETKHLPLLDFHIPQNDKNKIIVQKVLKQLNLEKGFLLESGKSYHYIGEELITYEELITLLSKALLFAPIIDRAWIAHQLLERSCSLRVSKKNGVFPTVIKKIL